MDNTSRIYCKKIPTFDDLKGKVWEFVESFQGLLSVETDSLYQICINSVDDGQKQVEFRLLEYHDESLLDWSRRDIQEEEIVKLPKVTCIEFSHNHRQDISWYLSCKLELFLAKAYEGTVIDEGIGPVLLNTDEFYSFKRFMEIQSTWPNPFGFASRFLGTALEKGLLDRDL